MAAPALGTVQLRQVRRGIEASLFFVALALAILPVLIPDGVDGFRIRDIGAASTEHTRPSCNPLFGKCNAGQKISGTSSSTIRLRRKFEGASTPSPRTNKIQPLVEESSEDVADDEGRFASGSNHVKSKSERLPSLERTVAKNIGGYSGLAGSVKLKASLAGSEEIDEDGENYENLEDDDEATDEDEDDDEENSAGDDDEENLSDSRDSEMDDAELDETDEEEEKDETAELDDDDDKNNDDDDDDDDDEDDGEQEQNEDESDEDSDSEDARSAESHVDELARIKYSQKDVKLDVANDRRNLKVPDIKSVEKDVTKKSIEIVEGAGKSEILKQRRDDIKIDDKTKDQDHGVSKQSETDQVGKAEEEIVDTKIVQSSKINESDEGSNDDADDDDDDDGLDENKLEEEATKPPRKLEKVRHADKSKSMESLRARPLEELSVKVEPPIIPNDAIEAKKVELQKPTPQAVPKPEVKPPSKPIEKISKAPALQEIKKPESKEKPKTVAPELKPEPKPKKEIKSQPKQAEKPKVKTPEIKSDKKSEKPKMKSKKRTEASITLPELNDLLLQVPSFTPNFTAIEDPVCQQHGKIFLRQLRGYKLWALQMLDSSAKIPSGLLRGNLNQLGDFDQCLGVKAHVKIDEKTVKVQGKYCLATLDLQATRHDMKIPVNLMQSRAFLRANMNEPTHFVPRFTTANWALCVPAACSPEDVQSVMEGALSAYNTSTGLKFTVGVDPDSCYVKEKPQPYSKETVAVLYFYAMTVCLVFVATLRDYCVTSQGQGSYSERIIMAFSLRRTTTALMQDFENGGDIRCIHGIRTIATILLYMAHKLIPISRIPFANRISLTEVANNPLSSILRVSLVYTDSFLLLSGVLTAYNMAKELNKRGEIRWFCRFVTRFIRLTPALLAVVFWYAFVMEHTGSGPQWSSVVKSNAELCKKNAWTNLLYIQNFFPFEEMCATHTHQLALDMQLSLIAPVLVFLLYNKPIVGILVTLFLLQVSATVRYLATTNNYLSVVIFHGMTLKHLYKTANLTYALPLHRATPYLFGVALGVLMRYTGKQFRMHKVLVITGWIVATALGLWSLLSPWRLARRDYTYDVEEATYYAVILPICWAASLCWIIFASFTDHGGAVNKFLSNHWLVVFSRLSYSVYLTQFAVFFYNVGTTRYASDFQLHRSIDLYESVTVIGVSVTLTLLLDLPMQEVKNVIMECTDGLTIDDASNGEKNDEVQTEDEKRIREGSSEERKMLVDGESKSSGWGWYNDTVSSRKIVSEYRDGIEPPEVWTYRKKEIPTWDWIQTPVQKGPRRRTEGAEDLRTERRSQSRQEIRESEYIEDLKIQQKANVQLPRDEDGFRRDGRSQSRASESKRLSAKDPDELSWEFRRRDDSASRASDGKRPSSKDFDIAPREFTRRERSLAKDQGNDSAAASTRKPEEHPPWEYVKRERSASQSGKDGKKAAFESLDVQSPALRLSTRSLPRAGETQRRVEREEEVSRKEVPKITKTNPPDEPRVSDEENWEYELRLRRQKLAADLPSEETGTVSEEEEWNILKRRSSAEGKMALLNDSPRIENFGAWSITKEPTSDSTSFHHEQSESEEENSNNPSRNDYRETRPPFREGYETQSEEETSWDPSRQQSYTGSQPTSIDEEGPPNYDFVLKRGSKRTSLQNLSRISQEEPEAEDDSGWDFVKEENADSSNPQTSSTGFFKRASIVKSQASEEDPEYLLPERPKLVEQEQEHPFKKAWQMQKSRSEEEGPVGFLVKEKDGKTRTSGAEGWKDNSQVEEGKRKPSTGGRTEDLSYFGGDEADSTSVSYPASNSGDSANLDWVEEDERSGASGHEETELESTGSEKRDLPQSGSEEREQRRHSKESNWEWNQEET